MVFARTAADRCTAATLLFEVPWAHTIPKVQCGALPPTRPELTLVGVEANIRFVTSGTEMLRCLEHEAPLRLLENERKSLSNGVTRDAICGAHSAVAQNSDKLPVRQEVGQPVNGLLGPHRVPPPGECLAPRATGRRQHDAHDHAAPAPTDDARDDGGIAKVKLCAKVKVKGEHSETEGSQTGRDSTSATVEIKKNLATAKLGLPQGSSEGGLQALTLLG